MTVDRVRIEVGKHTLTPSAPVWARSVQSRATLDGSTVTWLAVDSQLAGAVLLRDPLRPDANRTVRRLRAAGLSRLVMLTGDRPEPAQEIGTVLGLDEVCAEQSPANKVEAVHAERWLGPVGTFSLLPLVAEPTDAALGIDRG